MTKHRLMLSAASAALLASSWLVGAARADTTISTGQKTAVATSTAGNILIDASGSIDVKAANAAAVTINSSNGLINQGSISNTESDGAIGVLVDTSSGNLTAPSPGFFNVGPIDISGKGVNKSGIYIGGGNTWFGSLLMTSGISSTGGNTGSSISVKGDGSTALILNQTTTMDGDLVLSGPISMATNNETAGAGTLISVEGALNGNLIIAAGSQLTNIGVGARGVAVLGPMGACDAAALATVGQTCSTTSLGAFINHGAITVAGTATPNVKGSNPLSGSAVAIGNSIFGGFVNDGPQTSNANVANAVIAGSGAALSNQTAPVLVIDPGQSITASQAFIRGPVILGPVQTLADAADGVTGQTSGFSFINHGQIAAVPPDVNVSSVAVLIQGSSAANYTCFGAPAASIAAGRCITTATTNGVTTTVGGLLNSGSIQAVAQTGEKTTSTTVGATALSIGSYATIPRIVVAGELTNGSSRTPGNIQAQVTGPGGGVASGIIIGNLAQVPEISVLTGGTISALINTSSFSPTADFANSKTPFVQFTTAIADQSGSLKTINNAGSIAALNTPLTPGAGASVVSTAHAINLLANTLGGITINNSGAIQGDIYFGAAGNGNTLNVGNVGAGGIANAATGLTNTPYAYASISGRITAANSGLAPSSDANLVNFGSGTGHTLHVGGFGYVNSVILAQAGGLDVTVDPNGQLFVANTAVTGSLFANHFTVNGGLLGLNITQGTSSSTPVVLANTATIGPNARIGLQFGGFISSGTTAASVNNPTPQSIILISAPTINVTAATLANQNGALASAIPFLFESPTEAGSIAPTPLTLGSSGGNQTLVLTLIPRAPGLKNADGTAGLGLSGDAYNLFPYTVAALANDPTLGAAIATNLSVNNGVGAVTLNVAASQQKAQQVFSQFTPDVSGGTRQVAIMLTDQATGPVAARQRLLRSYGNETGELTLWGEEFAGMISNKGKASASGTITAFKDHGWGFALGMDAGSAKGGWYGGALTYYSGDVSETLPRASKTHQQWYILSGYSDWRGRHVFLDTNLNIGYGSLDGNRSLVIGDQNRTATSKRAALLGGLGANAGVIFKYGLTQVIPHVSLDGLSMREEGYTEASGGGGLNLQVAPYYANSVRLFLGSDVKADLGVFGVKLTPEARFGYRYDLAASPVKLRAGFLSTGGISTPGNVVTFVGPDPDKGNVVLGGSLSAGTDTWSLGVNYDWVRGSNGSTTQVGTLTLLGRI